MDIPATTTMGPVRLVAGDLDAMTAFYSRAIGLDVLERGGALVRLGAGGVPLVELEGDAAAPARPPRTTGLFHLALLVPSRAELARALHRVSDAGARFSGASDHLVSEALYLDDPEGNGIEIYRDRPRDEWRREADGELAMATLPLDVEGVLSALEPGGADEGMPAGTIMGHVHLQVRDTDEAERFYADGAGFATMVRGYPGALFVAAGGYHHHLGLNTWGTRDAPPPPAGARGLARFTVLLPAAADVDAVAGRLADAGHAVTADADGVLVPDPSGNRMLLAAA
ncbi:MAG: VOC family protein [Thermoleophilia bacterium]